MKKILEVIILGNHFVDKVKAEKFFTMLTGIVARPKYRHQLENVWNDLKRKHTLDLFFTKRTRRDQIC